MYDGAAVTTRPARRHTSGSTRARASWTGSTAALRAVTLTGVGIMIAVRGVRLSEGFWILRGWGIAGGDSCRYVFEVFWRLGIWVREWCGWHMT